jgi:hypothetical protein
LRVSTTPPAPPRRALRSTELLVFGNPKGGTPLMQEQQTAGIGLPLKALVWEDAGGRTWLTYDAPAWIAQRHGLGPPSAAAVQRMAGMLAAVAEEAAGEDHLIAPKEFEREHPKSKAR